MYVYRTNEYILHSSQITVNNTAYCNALAGVDAKIKLNIKLTPFWKIHIQSH